MILNNYPNRLIKPFPYQVFENALVAYCQKHMQETNHYHRYVIDDYNRGIILNMYRWLIRDSQCEWSPDKGIYLCGTIGCGKTTLMKGFLDCVMKCSGYWIPFYHSSILYTYFRNNGIETMKKNPIYIDELGREQLEVYVDGARIRPVEDLMALRYEYGACTFFTTNFKIDTLSRGFDEKGKKIGYGQYIGDRIKEMCNIVVMAGSSRRDI